MRARTAFLILAMSILLVAVAACAPAQPVAAPAAAPTEAPAAAPTEAPAAAPTEAPASSEPQELVISTWGFNMDLIQKHITKPFEEKYNVKIVYETGNNSDRLTKLLTRKDNPNIDVVHFAGTFTFRAAQEGLLQPIDTSKLSNYDQLYDWAQDPLGNNQGVGYSISSYPLIYRTDKIETPITSWRDLLREDVKGYVTIPDLATTFGPATIVQLARAYGGDIDNTEPAWERLPQLAEQLVTTYRRSSELTTLFQQEEVWLSPYSSFAIGNLLNTGLPLQRVIPEEGVPGSLSVVSIVAGSDKVDLAHKYIDFLLSQEVQEAMALDLVDSPTNMSVTVPDDIGELLTYGELIDSLIFLDQAKLNSFQDEWLERWNQIMLQ